MTNVAIVHDYITQRGGAERLVLSIAEAFPDAPVYTSFYEPHQSFVEYADVDVVAAPLNRLSPFRRDPRLALPLLASTFDRMTVECDVAVCSTSGWAHGANVSGKRLVYCHNPARWLYQTDQYLMRRWSIPRLALRALRPGLRRWDQAAAQSADRYLCNSTVVAERVRRTYGIDADVLFPAVSVDVEGPDTAFPGAGDDFYLVVARLQAYKGVDAVIDAFKDMDDRLVVVGTGPEFARLHQAAPPNVVMAGSVSDTELRWLYRNARAVITAAYEDFGLVPVEAAAYGTPTIALRYGGHLDTVEHGLTGWLFDRQSPSHVAQAIAESRDVTFDPSALTAHACRFSPGAFITGLRTAVREMAG